MGNVVVTYGANQAFLAGRLLDRLTLRIGEESLSVAHPYGEPDLDAVRSTLEGSRGLLAIVAAANTGSDPPSPQVHLAISMAIRSSLPVAVAEVHPGDAEDLPAQQEGGPPDADIARIAVAAGAIDAGVERIADVLHTWLAEGFTAIPRIEIDHEVVAAFIGFTDRAPLDEDGTPRPIASWSEYLENYGGFTADNSALLPYAVRGWFLNGGRKCYVVRIANWEPSDERSRVSLPARGQEDTRALDVMVRHGVWDPVAVVIEPPHGGADATGAFDMRVRVNDVEAEAFESVTLYDVEETVNQRSTIVTVTSHASDPATPIFGRFPLRPDPPVPIHVEPSDLHGDRDRRTGIAGLVIAEDVSVLVCPDLITMATGEDEEGRPTVDLGTYKSLQVTLVNHCEMMGDRMALLDAPPGMRPKQVETWRSDEAMYDSEAACLYYPWVDTWDQSYDDADSVSIPPSGHIAGIWAKMSRERGMWRAAANQRILGITRTTRSLDGGELFLLRSGGINPLRDLGDGDVRPWGTKTLSSNPARQTIEVERLVQAVSRAVTRGLAWTEFAPNSTRTRAVVSRQLEAFLDRLWQAGALAGKQRLEAFSVECNDENNRDGGSLVADIAISVFGPSRFLRLRFQADRGIMRAADG